jgi:hypothetical protein
MAAHKIVYAHYGEISYTAKQPSCLLEDFNGDINEQVMCCFSSDDFRLVPVNKYEVREITLPDFLSPKEWINNEVYWRYTWGLCKGLIDEPENIQRFLYSVRNEATRLAIWKLYKTVNFRSSFRESLKDRLITWIDEPAEARQYDFPFSQKQLDCIVDKYTALEAKRLSTSLYYTN